MKLALYPLRLTGAGLPPAADARNTALDVPLPFVQLAVVVLIVVAVKVRFVAGVVGGTSVTPIFTMALAVPPVL